MKFDVTPKDAFGFAINKGALSECESADNYAGDYMFMYADDEEGLAFKHRDTRKYVFV